MSNFKDTVTTICGVVAGIATAIIGVLATGSITLPGWVLVIAVILEAVSIAIIGALQGRNADGSRKTPAQIEAQKTE